MPELSHENFKKQPCSQEELDLLIEEGLIEDFIKKGNKKDKEGKRTPEGWIIKYGRKFREEIAKKRPELVELYRDDPEKAKKQIKKILYEIENIK